MKTKYYVRVDTSNQPRLEEHLSRSGIQYNKLSHDFSKGAVTILYSVDMDSEGAMALKLSVPLVGCLNIHRVLGKQTPKITVAHPAQT